MENKILDYMQVLSKLRRIENISDNIKRNEPIGYTTYNLPILHFTAGTGKNHIVFSASQHGCEIIATNFLLTLMDRIAKDSKEFEFLRNNEYTLHFLPILNPEGFLITTSTIRKIIRKDLPNDEAQEVYEDYVDMYRKDDRDCKLKLNTKVKRHQEFFGHIDPYVILGRKFRYIQRALIKMYEKNNIPDGTLAIWHSNGNGVDLNQNTPYNYKIQAIREGKKMYSLLRYNNIETTRPGPIGCPMKGKEFEYEPENIALLKFLLDIKNNKDIELCAYMNYHSTGGIIYHRPYKNVDEINSENVLQHMDLEEVYNRKIAEVYASQAKYRVINSESSINCFNDLLRLQIPGDILIELSTVAGNPLAPFLDGNYDKIINNNLKAVAYTLQKLPEMNRIKNEYIKKKEEKEISLEER